MEEVFETDPLYPSDSQVNYVVRSKAFYANNFPSVIILLYACVNSFPIRPPILGLFIRGTFRLK